MAFDGAKGLLVYNPAFWLILIGLPIWWYVGRRSFGLAMVAVIPALLVLATFSDWTGGYAPSGRYILEFLPVLLPAVGYVTIWAGGKLLQIAIAVVLALQLGLLGVWLNLHAPIFDSSHRNPLAIQIEHQFGYSLDAHTPVYALDKLVRGGKVVLLDISLAIVLLGYGLILVRGQRPQPQVVRKPHLPLQSR